ncbi:NADH dehydrogenase [Mucilaginibacter pedocola]|uniref:NADH dehydrogenase n=1 Tax=Mucilaginibacter pedocola TaxID=1792845 RepID=A0A1S9PKI5_9SPHI|nr:NADH dehydrogenase [Mucilaginibacter pedocola]OOQ61460.1 NADH dehydrogenase [Mucilaginibacter pedocola]
MIKRLVKRLSGTIAHSVAGISQLNDETEILVIGAMLSKQQWLLPSTNINDHEFKIFSQFGDDGIIQYLIKHVAIENKLFIEFGVSNYQESNTRFLMMNNAWGGFVMDGSVNNMAHLQRQNWYWKYNLTSKAVFIDADNINGLLAATGFSNIGILHIDLDGNDYFILKEVELSKLNPSIIIMEYNATFGDERAITVPYNKSFDRTAAHHSNLFYGASLAALATEANNKGYAFIGCNLAGNNSYFVRRDLLNDKVKETSLQEGYKPSQFKEGRDKNGALTLHGAAERAKAISGLEVLNIESGKMEVF